MAEYHCREGGCVCGAVRYRLLEEPIVVHVCHCRWCQRETGTAFATNALIETIKVEQTGEQPERVLTPSESGKGQTVFRCANCRVAVLSHYPESGERLSFVRVGTLDDPSGVEPDVHVYTESKREWVVLPDDATHYPAFYPEDHKIHHFGERGIARWRAAHND